MNFDRKIKASLAMFADGVGCAVAVLVCHRVANEGLVDVRFPSLQIVFACVLAFVSAYFFDLYRTINRYSKMKYVQQMYFSFGIYGLAYTFILFGTDFFLRR